MKISFRGDYALKALLNLSLNYNKGLIRIYDIAEKQDIPVKYLEQILLTLKGAGYVKSQRGSKGGYYLSKDPKDIRLGEIIRLMEGPVSPIICVSNSYYKKCNEQARCMFRSIWDKIRVLTEEIVDKITFEQMCEKYNKKDQEELIMYNI